MLWIFGVSLMIHGTLTLTTKVVKRKSYAICCPTPTLSLSLFLIHRHHLQWFHCFLFGVCVCVCVHCTYIFFPSCVSGDIISDRHTYALEPMTLTFYDWISDDISIIPWFWWHVPMCLSQWCFRLKCQYCLGNSDLIRFSLLPPSPTPLHTSSDFKIWLKYIENLSTGIHIFFTSFPSFPFSCFLPLSLDKI